MSVLISCEVGGSRVPPSLRSHAPRAAKTNAESPVKSKRKRDSQKGLSWRNLPAELGHDEPAAYLASRMAEKLYAPLIANEYSQDLIDVTRASHHRQLFPTGTRGWSAEQKQSLVDQIHAPYRARIHQAITQMFVHFPYVIHLSIRSFPLLHRGEPRRADVGLAYDPASDEEVDLCLDWVDEMYEALPMLKVRRNYPRRGTTDSITKAMRTEFADRSYLGIEVQFNRAWVGRDLPIRDEVVDGMCQCLRSILSAPQSDAA